VEENKKNGEQGSEQNESQIQVPERNIQEPLEVIKQEEKKVLQDETKVPIQNKYADKSRKSNTPKNGRSKKGSAKQSASGVKSQISSSAKGQLTESTKQPSEVAKGYQLEYRIKRLAFFMGYFPKVGVELRTTYDNESDVITDLDVYGIYVHKDFTNKTLWADCKSGKVEVHRRLSWIKGIMTETEVSDVIFVAPKVRTSVKEFARKSGIQVLDQSVISKLEEHYGINDSDWRGSWNPTTQFDRINQLSRIKAPRVEANQKIAKFIASDYWVNDNYSKVKKSITALRDLSLLCELALPKEEKATIKWAVYELVGLFTLAILDVAREIYYFHDEEKKSTIQNGLISSDLSNRRRNEIFDTAVRVAYSFVKNQYPDISLPDKLPNINLTPPNYFEALNDLLLRITNNPIGYYDILRLFDFMLMEYDIQDKPVDEDELRTMFNNYDELTLGVKTILHFLCRVTHIPKSFFQILG